MKKIQLWSVDRTEGKLSATAVENVDNTKTEQDLEELLVASPDLLMDGLTLIGRQVPTDGGGLLDLLGIDAAGRLVVFELKKGTLTRDAVAQVLDYASDLAALDAVRFGALIEKHSGVGVDRIEDFADWYRQGHPGESDFPLDRPRMVLVGLGADDRARRIVNFLAESQVDIQLMTFHAFSEDGKLFLARQIESDSPKQPPVVTIKESNLKALHDTAKSLGVDEFLTQTAQFIEARLGGYCWPGKQSYSFSLPPSWHTYTALYVLPKKPGSLALAFPPRAAKCAADAVEEFCQAPRAVKKSRSYAIELTFGKNDWASLEQPLDKFLAAIVEGWKRGARRPKSEPLMAIGGATSSLPGVHETQLRRRDRGRRGRDQQRPP